MDYKKSTRHALNVLSMPIIWAPLLPILIVDLFVEIYHHICFPWYGIEKVTRSHYIRIDRHRLTYLTWYDKLSCYYCGYVNGLFGYLVEIGGRTEQYWCGIKHKEGKNFIARPHQKNFMKYGDEKAYKKL